MTDRSQSPPQDRIGEIIKILRAKYPDAKCTLDFMSCHELLVSAILAAQCTDLRVNLTTPELFTKYPNVEAFANADPDVLEAIIKPTGFFRNKTKAIIESARQIVQNYNGTVPDSIDEMVKLSGVGRKTANLILGACYGKPAVVVDTHVMRVSQRLGLTQFKDPTKIEHDLRAILPDNDKTLFNHLIVALGREICKAPTPRCGVCPLIELCPYGQKRLTPKPA